MDFLTNLFWAAYLAATVYATWIIGGVAARLQGGRHAEITRNDFTLVLGVLLVTVMVISRIVTSGWL